MSTDTRHCPSTPDATPSPQLRTSAPLRTSLTAVAMTLSTCVSRCTEVQSCRNACSHCRSVPAALRTTAHHAGNEAQSFALNTSEPADVSPHMPSATTRCATATAGPATRERPNPDELCSRDPAEAGNRMMPRPDGARDTLRHVNRAQEVCIGVRTERATTAALGATPQTRTPLGGNCERRVAATCNFRTCRCAMHRQ